MKEFLCASLLAILVAAPAYADDVKVSKAWARATAPGQDNASIQLTITSKKDASLIGVESGSSQSGEIHSMVMEGGVMKMRALESLPLPAKTPVNLGEDGNHLMLLGLKKPLKAGRKLPFAPDCEICGWTYKRHSGTGGNQTIGYRERPRAQHQH